MTTSDGMRSRFGKVLSPRQTTIWWAVLGIAHSDLRRVASCHGQSGQRCDLAGDRLRVGLVDVPRLAEAGAGLSEPGAGLDR
jgi:hypothetical protein